MSPEALVSGEMGDSLHNSTADDLMPINTRVVPEPENGSNPRRIMKGKRSLLKPPGLSLR